MSAQPHVLILPGWYPSQYHPYIGDFVQYQTRLIYALGQALSLLHLDLDYRFIKNPSIGLKIESKVYKDRSGFDCFQKKGFYLPKITQSIIQAWAKNFLHLYDEFKHQWPKDHIIHAHTYLGGLGAYFIHQKYGIPYIITEHNTAFLNKTIPSYHKKAIQLAFDHAFRILAVSTDLKTELEAWTHTSVSYIPNFIDTDLFQISDHNNELFTFVCVGDLIKRKNIGLLIDAFADFYEKTQQKSRLLIIGDGPLQGSLQAKAKQINISAHIHFAGRLNQAEIAQKLMKSHVLVLPSLQETFGLVLTEAMACGLPVISTPSGGPKDIIQPGSGIYLPDFEVDSLSNAMLKLSKNYPNFNAKDIRQSVLNRFSAEVVSLQLQNLYDELAKQ